MCLRRGLPCFDLSSFVLLVLHLSLSLTFWNRYNSDRLNSCNLPFFLVPTRFLTDYTISFTTSLNYNLPYSSTSAKPTLLTQFRLLLSPPTPTQHQTPFLHRYRHRHLAMGITWWWWVQVAQGPRTSTSTSDKPECG